MIAPFLDAIGGWLVVRENDKLAVNHKSPEFGTTDLQFASLTDVVFLFSLQRETKVRIFSRLIGSYFETGAEFQDLYGVISRKEPSNPCFPPN